MRLRPHWRLGLLTVFLASPVYPQSLGDIARQELERKQAQPRRTTHVYDNDDLARPQILLSEDQGRVRASKKKVTPAASESAKETDGSDQKLNALPPSDLARLYCALGTIPQLPKPLPRSLQSMLGAQSLGYSTLSRSPVRRWVPPVPLDVSGTRPERVGKAIPRVEIANSEKPVQYLRVRVQPGDTLWKLAYKYLGHGKDWPVLVGRNPQVTDPQQLQVGTWLRLPEEDSDLKPPERVRIKVGDSLWRLTQDRFGNGRAWSCVALANPKLHSAHLIFPGQVMEIPGSCAATSSARFRFPEFSTGSSRSSSAQLLRQAH